jgi:hypothetical protein
LSCCFLKLVNGGIEAAFLSWGDFLAPTEQDGGGFAPR